MKNLTWLFIVAIFIFVSCGSSDNAEKTDSAPVASASVTPAKSSVINHTNTGNLSWYSMNDVENLVKKEKKMILVDVYTKWCGPCKMMDARTFTDKAVQTAINEKFYPVKFDAEGSSEIKFMDKTWSNPNHDPNKTRGRNAKHQMADLFKVPGYPTLVVMDDNFNIIKKIVGFKTPDKLLVELASI